jgi:SAM-dependent methyltransferase
MRDAVTANMIQAGTVPRPAESPDSLHNIRKRVESVYDGPYAHDYRLSDEAEIVTENHRHYRAILEAICSSLNSRAWVLDLGCGTGRYFHCLRKIDRLVGVDISWDMLRQARRPIRGDQLEIPRVDLVRANLLESAFHAESFDLIYSIGVLGEHSPFDLALCEKLYRSLKRGGKLFFTVVDRESRVCRKRLRRRLADALYPVFPAAVRRRLDERWRSFYMTKAELKAVMDNSPFKRFEIARHICSSPGWEGAHYECLAVKDAR